MDALDNTPAPYSQDNHGTQGHYCEDYTHQCVKSHQTPPDVQMMTGKSVSSAYRSNQAIGSFQIFSVFALMPSGQTVTIYHYEHACQTPCKKAG